MAKIIRMSIAGIQSTGKSFLIAGIKSVFERKGIMSNFNYRFLSDVNNPWFDKFPGFGKIEDDIRSGKGTTDFQPYIGEIMEINSNETLCYLMIGNIPGELFNLYYEEISNPGNFISFYKAFDELIQKKYRARRLLKAMQILSMMPELQFVSNFLKVKSIKNIEEDLWVLYEKYLEENYKIVYNNHKKDVIKYFSGFVFSYLADQTYLCIDPNLATDDKIKQQNKLIDCFTSNIVTNRNRKINLNFVITKFDTFFSDPNTYYLPELFNSMQDYFDHVEKYLSILQSILLNEPINPCPKDLKIDRLKKLIKFIQPTDKIEIDGLSKLPKNLYLTCVQTINLYECKRIPDNLDDFVNNKIHRLPIGCYEMVCSMLLKYCKITYNQLGIGVNLDNNKVVKAYLN